VSRVSTSRWTHNRSCRRWAFPGN